MGEVQQLLESSVPVNGEDGHLHSLLHYAAATEQPDIVLLLLEKWAGLVTCFDLCRKQPEISNVLEYMKVLDK